MKGIFADTKRLFCGADPYEMNPSSYEMNFCSYEQNFCRHKEAILRCRPIRTEAVVAVIGDDDDEIMLRMRLLNLWTLINAKWHDLFVSPQNFPHDPLRRTVGEFLQHGDNGRSNHESFW